MTLTKRIAAKKAEQRLVPVQMAARKLAAVPVWRSRLTDKDLTDSIYSNGSYVPTGSERGA